MENRTDPFTRLAQSVSPLGALVVLAGNEKIPGFGWVRNRGVRNPTGRLYLKLAVTDLSLSMVRVHVVAVPVQAPCQPTQGEPGSGVAVSVTTVPLA